MEAECDIPAPAAGAVALNADGFVPDCRLNEDADAAARVPVAGVVDEMEKGFVAGAAPAAGVAVAAAVSATDAAGSVVVLKRLEPGLPTVLSIAGAVAGDAVVELTAAAAGAQLGEAVSTGFVTGTAATVDKGGVVAASCTAACAAAVPTGSKRRVVGGIILEMFGDDTPPGGTSGLETMPDEGDAAANCKSCDLGCTVPRVGVDGRGVPGALSLRKARARSSSSNLRGDTPNCVVSWLTACTADGCAGAVLREGVCNAAGVIARNVSSSCASESPTCTSWPQRPLKVWWFARPEFCKTCLSASASRSSFVACA